MDPGRISVTVAHHLRGAVQRAEGPRCRGPSPTRGSERVVLPTDRRRRVLVLLPLGAVQDSTSLAINHLEGVALDALLVCELPRADGPLDAYQRAPLQVLRRRLGEVRPGDHPMPLG